MSGYATVLDKPFLDGHGYALVFTQANGIALQPYYSLPGCPSGRWAV